MTFKYLFTATACGLLLACGGGDDNTAETATPAPAASAPQAP